MGSQRVGQMPIGKESLGWVAIVTTAISLMPGAASTTFPSLDTAPSMRGCACVIRLAARNGPYFL